MRFHASAEAWVERLECIGEILRIAAENRGASAFLYPLYMRSDEVPRGKAGRTYATPCIEASPHYYRGSANC